MSKVKVLLHFDEEGYNSNQAGFDRNVPLFKAVLAAYAALGLPALSNEDLPMLFDDTENFIIDKMIDGKPLTLAGLPVKREMAKDFIVKPEGYEALMAAIEQVKLFMISNGWYSITEFELKNGELQQKPSAKEKMQERFKRYATTQKQADAFTHFQQIADSMNALSQLGIWFGTGAHSHANTIADAVKQEGPALNNRFSVDLSFITGLG